MTELLFTRPVSMFHSNGVLSESYDSFMTVVYLRIQCPLANLSRKKCQPPWFAGEENFSILKGNLFLQMRLKCFFFFTEISICAKHVSTLILIIHSFLSMQLQLDMKFFQHLVSYHRKNSLKSKLFLILPLDKSKYLSVIVFCLSLYHAQPPTLLKIKQELGERGLTKFSTKVLDNAAFFLQVISYRQT